MRPMFLVAMIGWMSGCAAAGPSVIRLDPPQTQPPVAHAERVFDGADGLPLFAQSWRPAQGDPKAVLVVVHGLMDHSGRYDAFAREAVARGYAVHALDLRGHGRSAGDRVDVDPFEQYLDDLDKFLANVRAQEPGRRVFLMGHSMGGAIATLYVLHHKPELAGLVLSAPALQPGADVSRFLQKATHVVAAVAPTARVLDLDASKFSRDPATRDALAADPLVVHDKGAARTAAGLLDAMDEIQSRAGELTLPLLVLHGTDDVTTNPEGSKAVIAKAASTDKKLQLYPGLVHDLLHEPEHAQVSADILGWLDTHTP